jgi:hypothetical protein
LFKPLSQIMRRGLPLKRSIHGEHNLVNAAHGDPADQTVDVQILWPNAIKRGQTATKDMVFPGEKT